MRILKAGNIQIGFENGALRCFKIDDFEVLRMVYFAVRDVNWGTFTPQIEDLQIIESNNSFSINYNVFFEENSIRFSKWKVEIKGLENDCIEFIIEGIALNDFKTNRAGFCVLHPIENIAGNSIQIIHENGEIELAIFPKLIAPHQPFLNIKSMIWELENSVCQLDFEGDIFEMEDQRNWGDSSYKTYCTPLNLPFPKLIEKGENIKQKVRFKSELKAQKNITTSSLIEKKEQFCIGTWHIKNDLSGLIINRLSELNLNHLSLEIDFVENWQNDLLAKIENIKTLNLPIDLTLNLSNNFELELLTYVSFSKINSLNIKYLTLLSKDELVTSQKVIDLIPKLKNDLKTKIGVGTKYNFTELNRHRFEAKNADYVQFSFNPQEHAIDDLTVLENAETLVYLVESAKGIYKKPVHISPITLKRKCNPYATEKSAIITPFEKQIDERQKTDFAANWINKLVKNLERSGVESVTIFQTHGDLGLMDEAGNIFPVFEAFKQ